MSVAASLLSWLLVAFFAVGAGINLIAPKAIRDDYTRWGYPAWFHYATAALELTVAVLIAFAASRPFGAALGAAVMASAAGTTMFHGEYTRAIAPSVVLVLTLALGAMVLLGG